MWTSKVRRFALRVLPPGKLLPDRQPAYVASWIYVFGVATLATLGLAIVSGFALALGGPDWYHYNSVGHFFNSMHLWSVELFMAFMVIHLWGKFWMAAWRGRRAMTWITGVIAFMASVVECFTGYLSQSNFDSQWIATNGKDAFNAVGIGAFFNVMNFGQMLMWHIVLIPIVLVAIVGAHVLMVRVRGVSHPLPAKATLRRSRADRKAAAAADAAPWRGATRRYDILKEGTVAVVITGLLVLLMAGLLSSPDLPPLSVQTWAKASAADFVGTAAAELDGTALAASYGPPYNNGTSALQQVGPVSWQKLAGVTQPINAAQTFVISPLSKVAPTTPALATALQHLHQRTSRAAADLGYRLRQGRHQQQGALQQRDLLTAPAAGPVPVMMFYELKAAQAGTLDADLLAQDQVLRHQLHQAAAVHRRRRLLRQPRHQPAPHRRPVGRHERDRQLPRPAMAVALPALVPRRPVQQLRQRRHLGRLPDRPRHHPAAPHPLHPRPARHPAADPGAPADLAGRPRPARRSAG